LVVLVALGRFGRIQIRSAWGWRNYLPWGILWTYDALMSIRRNQHGVYVGGFWISGLNRSSDPTRLESASIVSLVTNKHLSPKVATDPHYVVLSEANRVPPKAFVSLQFLFTEQARDGQPGVSEEDFWRDFGEFEFEAVYNGKTHRKRFKRHLIEAHFDQARPRTPTSHPRVTLPVAAQALRMEAAKSADTVKPAYTAKEREERYTAWSRIYRVLNEQCSSAIDKGSYVSNTWKESILANPKAYSESMLEFQRMASAALNEITAIYKEYEYLSDIRDYFENSWGATQHPMNEALNILRETLKRFPDNPPRAMVDLLDPQAQAFRQGVGASGRWITEAKAHAAGQIRELSNG